MEVRIGDKDFEKAIKRHEDAFEKELEEISTDNKALRQMCLKMKKSLLEQARQNNSMYKHAHNAVKVTEGFEKKVNNFIQKTDKIESELKRNSQVFAESIKSVLELKGTLNKEIDELRKERNKGFYSRIRDFVVGFFN